MLLPAARRNNVWFIRGSSLPSRNPDVAGTISAFGISVVFPAATMEVKVVQKGPR